MIMARGLLVSVPERQGALTVSIFVHSVHRCVVLSSVLVPVLSPAIISQEEFIEGALDDDWIREMLECDPSTVKVERSLKRDTALGTHG